MFIRVHSLIESSEEYLRGLGVDLEFVEYSPPATGFLLERTANRYEITREMLKRWSEI